MSSGSDTTAPKVFESVGVLDCPEAPESKQVEVVAESSPASLKEHGASRTTKEYRRSTGASGQDRRGTSGDTTQADVTQELFPLSPPVGGFCLDSGKIVATLMQLEFMSTPICLEPAWIVSSPLLLEFAPTA